MIRSVTAKKPQKRRNGTFGFVDLYNNFVWNWSGKNRTLAERTGIGQAIQLTMRRLPHIRQCISQNGKFWFYPFNEVCDRQDPRKAVTAPQTARDVPQPSSHHGMFEDGNRARPPREAEGFLL
jgi:hypothetical protein